MKTARHPVAHAPTLPPLDLGPDLPPVATAGPREETSNTLPTEAAKPWNEHYSFQVGPKRFSIQFLPVRYRHEYDEAQLDALAAAGVVEVSFALEPFTRTDGETVGGYGVTRTGDAFKILGSVGNGIVEWADKHRPDYLVWHAIEPKRQGLYDTMVRYFAQHRGSGWGRLEVDPFTGKRTTPGEFWIKHI